MSEPSAPGVSVVEVEPGSPAEAAVLRLVDELGQRDWVEFTESFHLRSHLLAAHLGGGQEPVGFLRFVEQPIGPDAGCDPVVRDGRRLTEAKILALGVLDRWRGRGVGTALQLAVIRSARECGCWQVRSHSSGVNGENHKLKLGLGFAVHPIVRGDDRRGCYFVLPLRGLALP